MFVLAAEHGVPGVSIASRSLEYSATGYKMLIETLEREFGGEHNEVQAAASDLFAGGIVDTNSLSSVRNFRIRLTNYGSVLSTYGRKAVEFSTSSQLFRDIMAKMFSKKDRLEFHKEHIERTIDSGRDNWDESVYGILEWLDVKQEVLARLRAVEKGSLLGLESQFKPASMFCITESPDLEVQVIPQDTSDADVQEVLYVGAQQGRRVSPVSYTHLTLPTNREV